MSLYFAGENIAKDIRDSVIDTIEQTLCSAWVEGSYLTDLVHEEIDRLLFRTYDQWAIAYRYWSEMPEGIAEETDNPNDLLADYAYHALHRLVWKEIGRYQLAIKWQEAGGKH